MTSNIILALVLAYLPLMVAGLWTTKQRPALSARIWGAALVLALVLAAINFATDRPWWLAALWAFNAVIDAVNVHLNRRRQRDRDIYEMWATRFQSQP